MFRSLFKVKFVAGRAQRSGGSVFEPFNGRALLLLQIDQILIENPKNAVQAAVDFRDLVRMPARFLNDAGHAGVDDRRRPAGLGHQ